MIRLTPEICERIWRHRFGMFCQLGTRRYQLLSWQLEVERRHKRAGFIGNYLSYLKP